MFSFGTFNFDPNSSAVLFLNNGTNMALPLWMALIGLIDHVWGWVKIRKSWQHLMTHKLYIYTYIKLYTTYITWKVRPHVFGLPKHHPKYPIKTAARGALRSTPRCKDVDLMDVGSLFQDLFSLENADYKQKKMLHVWNIYIWTIFGVNVGKYSIHGASGTYWSHG